MKYILDNNEFSFNVGEIGPVQIFYLIYELIRSLFLYYYHYYHYFLITICDISFFTVFFTNNPYNIFNSKLLTGIFLRM